MKLDNITYSMIDRTKLKQLFSPIILHGPEIYPFILRINTIENHCKRAYTIVPYCPLYDCKYDYLCVYIYIILYTIQYIPPVLSYSLLTRAPAHITPKTLRWSSISFSAFNPPATLLVISSSRCRQWK